LKRQKIRKVKAGRKSNGRRQAAAESSNGYGSSERCCSNPVDETAERQETMAEQVAVKNLSKSRKQQCRNGEKTAGTAGRTNAAEKRTATAGLVQRNQVIRSFHCASSSRQTQCRQVVRETVAGTRASSRNAAAAAAVQKTVCAERNGRPA